MIDIPLPARTRDNRMKSMIMGLPMKTLRYDFLLVDFGIKNIISVHIGINMDIWSHRNHDFIVKNTDSHRFRAKGWPKFFNQIRFPVAIGIFKDLNACMRTLFS